MNAGAAKAGRRKTSDDGLLAVEVQRDVTARGHCQSTLEGIGQPHARVPAEVRVEIRQVDAQRCRTP